MSFSNLHLTDSGRGIIVKALSGGSINFTKIQIGNGEAPDDAAALTVLQNPLQDISITEITTGEGIAVLNGWFDNADLSSGFYWTEIGVYATDDDIGEVLYAYAHAGDYAEYIPAYSGVSYLKTTLNLAVVVGDAETVTATIGEYSGYASREAFEAHTGNLENPHEVTKEQVGLGNVENYAFADAPVKFDSVSTLTTIASGDTIGSVFAKVKLAISNLISHLAASNPHSITCSKIGAAASSHTHAASAITSGTLGLARGGTGGTTAKTALDNLVASNYIDLANARALRGKDADGTLRNLIYLSSGNILNIGGDSMPGAAHFHTGNGMICLSNTDGTTRRYIRMSTAGVWYSTSATNLGSSGSRWGTVYCNALNNSSDMKLKENMRTIDHAKEIIMGLKPSAYNRKGKTAYEMGFGAQDVFELLQSLGIENASLYSAGIESEDEGEATSNLDDKTIKATDDEKLNWGIDYTQLIAPLVAVVQQQQKEIETMKKQMEELSNGIS